MTITSPRRLAAGAAAALALAFGAQAATAPKADAYISISKCINALYGNNNTDNDIYHWLYWNVPGLGVNNTYYFDDAFVWSANRIEVFYTAVGTDGRYYPGDFVCKDNGDGAIHSDEDFRVSYA